MASICQGKSSWPELLGVDGKCAVATIERENPLVEAIIVPEGSSIIENFRCDRVDDPFSLKLSSKSSWPELLGVDGKCAVATIERENPLVEAIIVPEGSSIIENFRCDRVWVWVDKDGIVYIVPVIG